MCVLYWLLLPLVVVGGNGFGEGGDAHPDSLDLIVGGSKWRLSGRCDHCDAACEEPDSNAKYEGASKHSPISIGGGGGLSNQESMSI